MVRTPERLRAASAAAAAHAGRRFGLTVGGALAALAALWLARGSAAAALALGTPAAALLLAAVAIPARLVPVEERWMRMAHAISRVTTPIVLAVIYFLVLTPAAFARRLFGGDPLAHRAVNDSYWARRERPRSDLGRQF
ncbi:MAG: SxtJ family membrane protein [Gemmatimonadaceae bacterium]